MNHDRNEWWRTAVLYHIYPLSFADSNGDGYGDLQGIINHLDYLAGKPDSLGVNAIWLSPVYQSPMKDWGYDVSNYETVDPLFGNIETLEKLIEAAHKRGMKVLMDYVANHTSDQHEWFKESRRSRDNPKRDWYMWADPRPDGSEPNNWLSLFGGKAWTFDPGSGQYYMHTFLSEQPDLNWHNPDVRAAMLNVLRFWMARGIDGFRADAVYDIMKDAQLRDDLPNPNYRPGQDEPFDALLHVRSQGQAELASVVREISDVIAEYPDRFTVSEAYLGVQDMAWLYRASGDLHNHAPFNFNLMTLPWEAAAFSDFLNSYEAALRPEDTPNYVLGNHDRARLASRSGTERARLLALMQLTLRGMAVIYYGDEIGMENVVIKTSKERDPWGIRVPGFGLGRDGERTPMQWDETTKAGFSTAKSWLPLHPNARTVDVAVQRSDSTSLWHLYHKLIQLRNDHPELATAPYQSITAHDEVLTYNRGENGRFYRIVLNFAAEPRQIEAVRGELLASTHFDTDAETLGRYEGRLYLLGDD